MTSANALLAYIEAGHTMLSLMARYHQQTMPLDNYKHVRHSVLRAFEQFEYLAQQQHLSDEAVHDMKYAFAAWWDEWAVGLDWPGRQAWLDHSLQRLFFDDCLAGEGFFQRMANAFEQQQVGVLLMYYFCLLLGFAGRYRFASEDSKQDLMAHWHGRLHDALSAQNSVLVVERECPKEHRVNKRWWLTWGLGLYGAAQVGLYALCHWVYHLQVAALLPMGAS